MFEEFLYDQKIYSDTPYRRLINLWKSVITQAIKDVSDDDEKVSQDAYEWIKNNDRDCFNSFLNLCVLCEVDSKKTHGHLYISTDINKLVYNCFRCESSGTLLGLLHFLKINPKEYLSDDLLTLGTFNNLKDTSNIKRTTKTLKYELKQDLSSHLPI